MHDRIIESRFYDELGRYPSNYVTVEVACALEGIAHAYAFCTDQRKFSNFNSRLTKLGIITEKR